MYYFFPAANLMVRIHKPLLCKEGPTHPPNPCQVRGAESGGADFSATRRALFRAIRPIAPEAR